MIGQENHADLTGATMNVVGLALTLPEQCPRCTGRSGTLSTGRGTHRASILCACGKHLGWLSDTTFNFLSESIGRFGRPTSPISIRRNCGASPMSSDADSGRSQPASN
jgi:hypothetical protein